LNWANTQNPGIWANHCRVTARAAEVIAGKCALDTERAYISGLMHDIGRYEGVRALHHIYAGYCLLKEKGYAKLAEICLSHSYAYQDIGAYCGEWDVTPEELSVISSYLENARYNDYDKLIQLCDAMCSAQGVCLIEKRIVDVTRRYGFNGFTLKKWNATFSLKEHFDEACQTNIYDLFREEIRDITFKK
jgi:hypothetical protein